MSRYVDIEPYEDCRIVLHDEDKGIRCRDLPAADVAEVRHGRWAKKIVKLAPDCEGKMQPYMWQPNMCSICEVGQAVRTNYCPNCGARMDGDEE